MEDIDKPLTNEENERLAEVIAEVIAENDEDFKLVTAQSIKCCEIILYPPLASIDKVLDIIKEKAIKDFALILHDRDDKKAHIHCLLWFYSAWPTSAVIKWFEPLGVTASNIGRIKNKKGALAYLTHANRPNKFQYDISEVVRSEGLKEELETATTEAQRKIDIQTMCDKVALGEMSPRSLYNALNGVEIRQFRKLIDGSVDARLLKSMTITEKDMKVFYIVGPAGSGKSTLARFLALNFSNEAPYISSSSNDPLDGYLLEPVIILDDLRGDAFKYADLLKLLDNYVPSSIKCRYKNKSIDAKYMFITSTRRPEELYSASTFQNDDNLAQLQRRIQAVYFIEEDGSIMQGRYVWNTKKKGFQLAKQLAPIGNISVVFNQLKVVEQSRDIAGQIADLLGNLSAKVSKKSVEVPPAWLFDDDGDGNK